MTNWLPASLIALCSFGFWGFFTKLSVDHIDYKSALIYQCLGVAIVGLIGLGFIHFKPAHNAKGLGFAVLTGLAYGLGCFFYFIAAAKGRIITVITLTSLYPAVTIALAYFLLREPVYLKQIVGAVLAIVAIIILSC